MYKIELHGLQQDEEFTLQSVSGKEKFEDKCCYNSLNDFLYSPDVIGQKGGMATVTIKRKSGSNVKIKLPWGTQQNDFIKGKQIYRN